MLYVELRCDYATSMPLRNLAPSSTWSQRKNKSIKYVNYLNRQVEVKIDRPLNSFHPKHGLRYEVNYGFVPGTMAEDGEEIDVYVLGVARPLEKFRGKCVAVIHRTNDNDDKLVVIPAEMNDISDEEIKKLTHFQEKYFKSVIIRKTD